MSTLRTRDVTRLAWEIAYATRDAYSFYRYSFPAWRNCCALLLKRGYNRVEVECIMRSRITRWAADTSAKPYSTMAKHLAALLDESPAQWRDYIDDTVLAQMMPELDEPESPAPHAPQPPRALHLVWSR